MTHEEREKISLQTFLGPDETKIGEIDLRPLSLGSFCLLREGRNEFLAPRGPGGSQENEILAVLEYVYIHTAPIEEVQSLILDITQLRPRAVAYGLSHPVADTPRLVAEIKRSFEALSAASFEVVPKPGSSKSEPGEPPNS